jgi:cytochrome c2
MEKIIILLIINVFYSSSLQAFVPSKYFQKKCMSCHTVGHGDDVGPDLKGVAKKRDKKWLIRFIQESQSMVEEGDPIANELFVKYKRKKMPDQELSDREVELLINYIDSGKVKVAVSKFRSALDANPFELELGKKLFTGEKRFSKGGPACLSCHLAGDSGFLGGGGLGPDLTNVYTSYKDKGLSKVIRSISFPTMIPLYKKRELTNDEAYQVKSYLWSIDREEKKDHGFKKKFFFLGLIGFLLVLGFFDLLWKGRVKNTRRPFKD